MEDPLLRSARREMWVSVGIWAAAVAVTVGVSAGWGYGRSAESLTYVLGFPDWVFWGIIVPWGTATVVSVGFSLWFMEDADFVAADCAADLGPTSTAVPSGSSLPAANNAVAPPTQTTTAPVTTHHVPQFPGSAAAETRDA